MITRIIETPSGKIIGEEKENCIVFNSVPYAITERFEDPKEVEKWDIFDATARPKNCHQRFEYVDESKEGGFYYKEFDGWRNSDYVESPMTLTIVTSKDLKQDCPVICYVHGGSYENGHSEDCPFGDSDEYAKRGIVLVSIGYRLNVFGLFNTGNYCLKDIIFAVKWTQKNIAGFGGDSSKITLMGQSAGAMAVYNVLLSNQLDGIINGAVMMSGAGILPSMAGPKTKEENSWFWDELIIRCGCKNIEELKRVDHSLLWKNWYDLKAEKGTLPISVPGIDGEIIKDTPGNIVKNKKDQDIPLIVGVTSQDMFPFMIFDLALSVGKKRAKYHQSNVYGYFFDVRLPGNSYGAFHASDLWYNFGNFKKSWRPFDQSDEEISKTMIDYISNFARTQNPNGTSLAKWPPISKKNHHFRWFHKGKEVMISPLLARKKLLHSTFKDKGPF